MKFRKLAAAVAIAAIGSFTVAPMVLADDKDHDGVANQQDKICEFSDVRPTVIIGDCDSGAPNPTYLPDQGEECVVADPASLIGCTISDLVANCLLTETTNVKYEKCVKQVAQTAKNDGFISAKQSTAIFQCAQKLDPF
jgi:hypothetical protein